jgi:hypothetical protein
LEDSIAFVHKKYWVSEDYSYQIKKAFVYFDDARRGLGDVTLIKEGEGVPIEEKEWEDVERFFREFVIKK